MIWFLVWSSAIFFSYKKSNDFQLYCMILILFLKFRIYVYLGAACLPLNVVENQTRVGRLCRPESVHATGHSWRTGVNIATKQPRHSRAAVVATHNNFVFSWLTCDFCPVKPGASCPTCSRNGAPERAPSPQTSSRSWTSPASACQSAPPSQN